MNKFLIVFAFVLVLILLINKISNIKLLRKDIEKLDLENSFYDVILLLFNVAGYLKNFNNMSLKHVIIKIMLYLLVF